MYEADESEACLLLDEGVAYQDVLGTLEVATLFHDVDGARVVFHYGSRAIESMS